VLCFSLKAGAKIRPFF